MLEEAHLAESRGILCPVWIEKIDLPLGFARLDTIDLTAWDGAPRAGSLDRVLDQVARLTARAPAPRADELREYEDDWRAFGALPLIRMPLVPPLEDKVDRKLVAAAPLPLITSSASGDAIAQTWETLKTTTSISRLRAFVASASNNPLQLAAEQRIEELEIAEPARRALAAVPKELWESCRLRAVLEVVLANSSTSSLRAFAAQNDARAQALLAWGYSVGMGSLTEDQTESVRLYRASSDQGDPMGQAGLGVAYMLGTGGLKTDAEVAVRLFQLSSKAGNSWATAALGRAYQLGEGVEVDQREAVRLFEKAAQQGSALGIYDLSIAYRKGLGGIAQDPAKSLSLIREAVAIGFSVAETELARMYESGDGVPQDRSEARRLLRLAASKGDVLAKSRLEEGRAEILEDD